LWKYQEKRSLISYIMGDNVGKFGITKENVDTSVVYNVLLPLQNYVQGFLKGYNTELKPFIDTIEAKKELVIIAARKSPRFDMAFFPEYTLLGRLIITVMEHLPFKYRHFFKI